ncbi:unnamed protein product [Anisakis simplex]|uniref:Uncharacterized protein n=1 Tax=Anisakis simplex TaxID=6269 RepID=A0A3P6NG27_ANISI|nr:unnamed protein product [Anisakis simplex]
MIGRLIDAGADLEMPDKCGKKAAEYGDEDEDVKKILDGERIQTEETSSALQANDALASEATASHGNDSEDDALLSYRIRSLNTDDISAMDYLTRLRLAKLLDSDEKWIILADHLGCGHMVEFIRVCTDETSSPTMILLDQYEVSRRSCALSLASTVVTFQIAYCVRAISFRLL